MAATKWDTSTGTLRACILKVGDVWLPGIRELHITSEDIDREDSGRDEEGTMQRSVLREGVIHAQVTHILTREELIEVCGLVKGDSQVSMTLFIPGAAANDPYKSGTFYVSKLDYDLVRYQDRDWWQLGYTVVEV